MSPAARAPGQIRQMADLLRDHGYDVCEARHGAEALVSMRRRRPALVFLDLMMPVVDGWQVLQTMASDPSLDGIPVCVLSAMAHGLEQFTVSCVVNKPARLDALLAVAATYCRPTAAN